jgi:UDP-N-acetylmuramyl pentapeptide phosphotransferase/UDP-N-acetylglucosamine-1-phosphate transferase
MAVAYNFYFDILQPQYRVVLAFIIAALVNWYAIPVIIKIAKDKKLNDDPDTRMNHSSPIPNLGGLGIYAAIVSVSLTFINTCGINSDGNNSSHLASLSPIIGGLTLIFFVGMKDDLIKTSVWKKLVIEFLALFILVVIGDVRLDSMQGMFSIGVLRYRVSVGLSILAGIVITNAFKLIDGIDGLAASVAMLGCTVFGSYFIAIHQWEYAIFSFTVVGSLIPFLLYNAFGKTNKIFMGDTGSLILGFVITLIIFRFNELHSIKVSGYKFVAAPAFSFAVIILPLFDTIRVFILRIYRNENPFKADRGHIHHILLNLGFTHLQSTLILIVTNMAFIAFAYFFNFLGNSVLMYIMIPAAILLTMLASWLSRRKMEPDFKHMID